MTEPVAWSFSRLNSFETCPKKFYHISVQKDVKESEGEAIIYGKMVHKALENRVKSGTPLPLNLTHLEKYAARFAEAPGNKLTEQQLCIDKNFAPCDWFSKEAWCRSILDLAIVSGSKAVLVDYKTGKISEDFTQMRLAAVMFMLHMPDVQETTICYLWTKHKRITSEIFTRAQIKELISEMMPRLNHYNAAHANKDFPPRPGWLCKNYCPVIKCPHNGE